MEEKAQEHRQKAESGQGNIQPPNSQVYGLFIFFYRLNTLSPAICTSHPTAHPPQIYTMDSLPLGDTVFWHLDLLGNKY